jgi:hypothetical protein
VKKIMTVFAVAAMLVSGSAMAQKKMGAPKAGTTRAQALATAGKMFGRIDTNGDGSFDLAEVTASLQARAAKSGKTFKPKAAARMMSRSDTNADGKVTLEEFTAAAGTTFDNADTNKNGTIDADEAPAAPAAGAAPSTDAGGNGE